MKNIKTLTRAVVLSAAMIVPSFSAFAADINRYTEICNAVIRAAASGNVGNIDALVADLDEATAIGIEISQKTIAKHPEGKALLEHLIANIDVMKSASIDVIEHDWHHGGAFKAKGIDHDGFDHYGPVIGAKDAVVHPLTARVALAAYKQSPNEELLETVSEELQEIVGQLKFLDY